MKRTSGASEIIEEDNYYAFEMKHSGYNNVVSSLGNSDAQKYKYQEQERNEELGLNWDSFKYRNYDYAIGRFFNVDPLAEKYAYNSPYAFQENKMGMGRELEGLEMTSERSRDGKSTLTIRVKPFNNGGNHENGTPMIPNDQFRRMVDARKTQVEKSFSGKTGEGLNVTAKVIESKNATLVWEYNTMLHGKGVVPEGQNNLGHTDDIGSTQSNITEVNVVSVFGQDANGNVNYTDSGHKIASRVGTHENGHEAGLEHPEEMGYGSNEIKLHQEVNRDGVNNLMTSGTNITPLQRSLIIKTVEQQQPQP